MGFRSVSGFSYRHDPHSPFAIYAITKDQHAFCDDKVPQDRPIVSTTVSPPRSPLGASPTALAPTLPSYLMRRSSPAPEPYIAMPPVDALHKNLRGAVNFVPYPDTPFVLPPPYLPKTAMSRVFIGQLPYDVTDMQLQWLCYTFGNGVAVHFPERITRHGAADKAEKIPTGCVHAYVDPSQVEQLFAFMNGRLLIDDPGVWVADSPSQQVVLEHYCEALKGDRKHRASRRPHSTVVAQVAHSTYVPRPPSYRAFHKQQRA